MLTFEDTTPMPAKLSKPIYLNASALKHTGCDQAYAYLCVDGLVDRETIEVLVFGTAVHLFVEEYTRRAYGKPDDMFIDHAVDAFLKAAEYYKRLGGNNVKNLNEVCMAFESIEQSLSAPFEVSGKLLIEHWFAIPCDGVDLCGTIDRITFDGRWISAYDYKTSREWDREKVLRSYENSTQMMFYPNVIHRWPEKFCTDPAFIDAAKALRIRMHIVPCFITTTKDKPVPQWRIGPDIPLSRQRLDEYHALLLSYIPAILDINAAGYGMKNGWISELCRKCDYNKFCHELDPMVKAAIIDESYLRRPYNPQHHK